MAESPAKGGAGASGMNHTVHTSGGKVETQSTINYMSKTILGCPTCIWSLHSAILFTLVKEGLIYYFYFLV